MCFGPEKYAPGEWFWACICMLVIVLYVAIVTHLLTSISKSFVGLKTGYKRIYMATYHDEIILGD